jgi:primosomal protein N' (replication factor Y)
MLAKGHDFPGVTLVVLLDIDHGLFGTDFRAAERMAQQVTQVAGRAGRGETPGRVLIQTRHPEHPLLQVLLQHGYSAFAMQSLEERRQAGFPPFAFQALIRAEAGDANQPRLFLAEAVKTAGDWSEGMPEFWGPVPAIMQKKAGKHRFHLLLQSASRAGLHRFLDEWLEKIQQLPSARKVRWSIDIDPQDFYS